MIERIVAPNPGAYTLDGTCTYLIDRTICIDPGPDIESHLDAITTAAPQLRAIVVTHRHGDHAPAALPLARRTGARLYAPDGVGEGVDHVISDGEIIVAGDTRLTAIATPGHTSEHFCFITPDGDLFTGDTVLGSGTTVIFPPDGHMGSYLASLRRLLDLRPRVIYPGHGPKREDAISLLDQYIEHRLERERQIIRELGNNPTEVLTLRQRIYPDLDPRLHRAAELQLESHLVHLEEQRRVTRSGAGWRRV